MIWFNPALTCLFVVLMAAAYGYFLATSAQRDAALPDDMLTRIHPSREQAIDADDAAAFR